MKKYIRSNISTELHNMSKPTLESVLAQIIRILNDDSVSKSSQAVRIQSILGKFNLRR
jgi:hypothetical protein